MKQQVKVIVSGMKLRSEKNRDGGEERDTEAGAAKVTPTDPFEEGEQTLIRPDHHHHEDPGEPGEELEPEETEENSRDLGAFRGRSTRGTIV